MSGCASAGATPARRSGTHACRGESPADGWDELAFELGQIDVELAPGDALELKVQVPAESEHHVWLAYDSLQTPSRFVFDSAGLTGANATGPV